MIAKISKGNGFGGLLNYNLDEKKGEMLDTNMKVSKDTPISDLVKQFRAYSNLNKRCKNPVLHISISLEKKVEVSDEKFKEIGAKFLDRFEKKMNGGEKSKDPRPFVIVRHTDTAHSHIHIITTRVDSAGKVLKDNKDYKAANEICRELEKEMGLQVVNAYQLKGKKSTPLAEINMEKRRRKENSSFTTVRKDLIPIIDKAKNPLGGGKKTLFAFVASLKKDGVEVYLNTSKDHSRINGISFSLNHDKQNRVFKGSAIGKAYTWSKIQNDIIFDPKKDKELVALLAENKPKIEKFDNKERAIIVKTFEKNLIKFQEKEKKPPVFNLNYRMEKIKFTDKQLDKIDKLNSEWNKNNFKNDPIKHFENTYKNDRLSKYYNDISQMKALPPEERIKQMQESVKTKELLNSHLKIYMDKEKFQYSKAINDRIKPLMLTKNDNEEIIELSKQWSNNNYKTTPMAYVYDRIQVHQSDYTNNLNKSLKRLDEQYPYLDEKFSSKVITDKLLQMGDKTNYNKDVPTAIYKFEKEVLSQLEPDQIKDIKASQIVDFVTNQTSSQTNLKSTSITDLTEPKHEPFTENSPVALDDLFKGIGGGTNSGAFYQDDKEKKKKPRKRKMD